MLIWLISRNILNRFFSVLVYLAILETLCLSTPMETAWLSGENVKISAMRPGSSFSIAEASRKRIRDDMKIQQTDLTNARLIKKYKSGRVTFKCQKVLWNISLAIKEYFRIERGTQNTNFWMNNSIKKQIYPKISHKHLSGPIVRYNSLSVTKTHVTSFIRREKPTDY